MHNSVEDGIGQGWVLDLLMPINRELSGKYTRGFAVT